MFRQLAQRKIKYLSIEKNRSCLNLFYKDKIEIVFKEFSVLTRDFSIYFNKL